MKEFDRNEAIGTFMFYLYLIVFALCMAFGSCKPKPPVSSEKVATSNQVSYTKTETIKLDTVAIAADTSRVEAQLQVDPVSKKLKPFKAQSGGKRSKLTIEVDSAGQIRGQCNCEAERATIASKDTQIKQLQAKAETSTTVEAVPIPYTAWYDVLARVVALLLTVIDLILILIYIIHRKWQTNYQKKN